MAEYDELRFGCEFEFYPNTMLEEEMTDDLSAILKPGIKLKKDLPNNDDNHMNYKKEPSLSATGGKEITVPICSYNELKDYIINISKIINEYASTNEATGFHIHISTVDESIEIDFYKFMLLCDEAKLLNNWGKRNSFCLNVMDILTILDLEDAKKAKNKKGRVWNLEKRKEKGQTNHVEIRTIGGTNYQQKVEQILIELDQFIKIFQRSLKNANIDEEYKALFIKHYEIVKSAQKERREKFLQLIN